MIQETRQIQPRRPMQVQNADGPVATIQPPDPGDAGPQLRKPINFAPPPSAGQPIGGGGSRNEPAKQLPAGGVDTGGFTRPPMQPIQPDGKPGPAVAPPPTAGPTQRPQPNGQPSGQPAAAAAPAPATPPSPPAPVPMPAPVNFAPPAAAQAPAPGTSPAVTQTPIDPNAQPGTIGPTRTQGNQALLARLQQEAGRMMDQPTAWDDELAGQVKASAARGIERNYDDAGRSLAANLAKRGIAYSTIAGDDIRDLEVNRAGELSGLDTSIARERANALASGRSSALSAAREALGMGDAMDRADRSEARGERGYVDNLRNTARQQSLEELVLGRQFQREDENDFQAVLDRALGYGMSGAGINQVGNAGAAYGSMAGQYGDQAAMSQQQLADLAQLAMQLFGGGGGGQ